MTAETPHQVTFLTERDWTRVECEYVQSDPYNYSVLDDFFTPEKFTEIRENLLSGWGWQYKNWQANELYVRDPKIPEIQSVAVELKKQLPKILDGLEFVRCWSFMHQRNVGLKVHADDGAVAVNVWMTPDEFNLLPQAGGLVLFDVKRDPTMLIHEFNTVERAEQYYKEHTKGASEKIEYGCNRAVLFDASTFHESDTVSFREEGAHTYRINLSLLFDDPEEFTRRRKEYDD
ncbi:MAG: hypothetical protein ACRDRS_12700 [Pseudonocardiaceae bacterium]